jgi:hypothetical protein
MINDYSKYMKGLYMKRIIQTVIILGLFFGLLACTGENLHERVFSETMITFSGNDEESHVTGNITLRKVSVTVPDAVITWTSSDSALISIQNNIGLVTPPQADETVSLTVTVIINNIEKSRVFTLTVIKTIQAEDHVAPLISGATAFNIIAGSPDQDWLEGVSATDDVDGDVSVTIFENTVNLNQAGVYHLIYEALDKAGNRGTATVSVTVTDANGHELYKSNSVRLAGGFTMSVPQNHTALTIRFSMPDRVRDMVVPFELKDLALP